MRSSEWDYLASHALHLNLTCTVKCQIIALHCPNSCWADKCQQMLSKEIRKWAGTSILSLLARFVFCVGWAVHSWNRQPKHSFLGSSLVTGHIPTHPFLEPKPYPNLKPDLGEGRYMAHNSARSHSFHRKTPNGSIWRYCTGDRHVRPFCSTFENWTHCPVLMVGGNSNGWWPQFMATNCTTHLHNFQLSWCSLLPCSAFPACRWTRLPALLILHHNICTFVLVLQGIMDLVDVFPYSWACVASVSSSSILNNFGQSFHIQPFITEFHLSEGCLQLLLQPLSFCFIKLLPLLCDKITKHKESSRPCSTGVVKKITVLSTTSLAALK